MNNCLLPLYLSAASIAFIHAISGPDHYLPFIAMSRARAWSLQKTILVTVSCGVGHVLSSVVLGFVGVLFGIGIFKLEEVETTIGDLAGWLLVGFGVAYSAWGVWLAIRNKPHSHRHNHPDEASNAHTLSHPGNDQPPHDEESSWGSLTPWVLFTIFFFGPCETLIPFLMYPAAEGSLMDVVMICLVFGSVTILTMTTVVVAAFLGLGKIKWRPLERYGHFISGLIILACGVVVKFGL